MQLYDKTFFTLAYPFVRLCVLCVVFSFFDDHQFIDVGRCEKSSWSTEW